MMSPPGMILVAGRRTVSGDVRHERRDPWSESVKVFSGFAVAGPGPHQDSFGQCPRGSCPQDTTDSGGRLGSALQGPGAAEGSGLAIGRIILERYRQEPDVAKRAGPGVSPEIWGPEDLGGLGGCPCVQESYRIMHLDHR